MKYYLVEITTYTDGTRDGYGVYAYDTVDAAVAMFHQKMSGAMKSANYASELLYVLDSEGNMVRIEKWIRSV